LLAAGDAAGGRRELSDYLQQTQGTDPRLAVSARRLLKDLERRSPRRRPPPRTESSAARNPTRGNIG
jgi:hypothetical protein